MSKTFWHTGTLFLQNGKYYKWSYKHVHCKVCGTCDHKHKGRWLCTSCWDKARDRNPERKIQKKRASKKFHESNYVPIPVEERKKMGPKPTGDFDPIAYKKRWYQENKAARCLIAKSYRLRKAWFPCLEVIVEWKSRYMPFRSIVEKPRWCVEWPEYDAWKKNAMEYWILMNYYSRERVVLMSK